MFGLVGSNLTGWVGRDHMDHQVQPLCSEHITQGCVRMDDDDLQVRRLLLSGQPVSLPGTHTGKYSSFSGGNVHVPACAPLSRACSILPAPPFPIYPHGYRILHFVQRALGAAGIAVPAFSSFALEGELVI